MRNWLWLGLGVAAGSAYACGGFTNTGFGGAGQGGSASSGKGGASGSGVSSMAGGLSDAVGTQAGSTVASSVSASSSTAASSSSGGGCAEPCGAFFTCCAGKCVNLQNDPLNCGKCPNKCEKAYCQAGTCGAPPCLAANCGSALCCGMQCCKAGQLCCNVQQGGAQMPGPTCFDPVDGTCPKGNPGAVCAAPDTPIATPAGERPIAELGPGDLVYSVDHGRLAVVPIAAVQRNAVSHHQVMRVALASGRVLRVSAPHPTADGRSFGALAAGDSLGGVAVRDVARVPYAEAFTYDVLPASDSGAYFAAGALIGSTMTARPAPVGEASWDLRGRRGNVTVSPASR